uniref:WAP domain-containing protein n=1 Tax=Homalodisca liturata TaxID=320908 RepID=A0A1B6J568_9HEMI
MSALFTFSSIVLLASSSNVLGDEPCWKSKQDFLNGEPPDVTCRGNLRCCGLDNTECCPLGSPPADSSPRALLPRVPALVAVLYMVLITVTLWILCRAILSCLRNQDDIEETPFLLAVSDDDSKVYLKKRRLSKDCPVYSFTFP